MILLQQSYSRSVFVELCEMNNPFPPGNHIVVDYHSSRYSLLLCHIAINYPSYSFILTKFLIAENRKTFSTVVALSFPSASFASFFGVCKRHFLSFQLDINEQQQPVHRRFPFEHQLFCILQGNKEKQVLGDRFSGSNSVLFHTYFSSYIHEVKRVSE